MKYCDNLITQTDRVSFRIYRGAGKGLGSYISRAMTYIGIICKGGKCTPKRSPAQNWGNYCIRFKIFVYSGKKKAYKMCTSEIMIVTLDDGLKQLAWYYLIALLKSLSLMICPISPWRTSPVIFALQPRKEKRER